MKPIDSPGTISFSAKDLAQLSPSELERVLNSCTISTEEANRIFEDLAFMPNVILHGVYAYKLLFDKGYRLPKSLHERLVSFALETTSWQTSYGALAILLFVPDLSPKLLAKCYMAHQGHRTFEEGIVNHPACPRELLLEISETTSYESVRELIAERDEAQSDPEFRKKIAQRTRSHWVVRKLLPRIEQSELPRFLHNLIRTNSSATLVLLDSEGLPEGLKWDRESVLVLLRSKDKDLRLWAIMNLMPRAEELGLSADSEDVLIESQDIGPNAVPPFPEGAANRVR